MANEVTEILIPPSGSKDELQRLAAKAVNPVRTEFDATADFQNSWVADTASQRTPAMVVAGNYVELEGAMKSGTVGSPMFTIPDGFRPAAQVLVPVANNGAVGFITVDANGDVTLLTGGSNTTVSLDGVGWFREV